MSETLLADELAELQALEQKQGFEPDPGLDAFLQAEALTGQHSHIATVSWCLCLRRPPPLLRHGTLTFTEQCACLAATFGAEVMTRFAAWSRTTCCDFSA